MGIDRTATGQRTTWPGDGTPGSEERNRMRKQKEHFRFTVVVLVLLGVILPLAVGIKDIPSLLLPLDVKARNLHPKR